MAKNPLAKILEDHIPSPPSPLVKVEPPGLIPAAAAGAQAAPVVKDVADARPSGPDAELEAIAGKVKEWPPGPAKACQCGCCFFWASPYGSAAICFECQPPPNKSMVARRLTIYAGEWEAHPPDRWISRQQFSQKIEKVEESPPKQRLMCRFDVRDAGQGEPCPKCRSNVMADYAISGGRVRRECDNCGRSMGFPVWWGDPEPPGWAKAYANVWNSFKPAPPRKPDPPSKPFIPIPPLPITPRCRHSIPSTWVKRANKAYCMYCDRFIGGFRAAGDKPPSKKKAALAD